MVFNFPQSGGTALGKSSFKYSIYVFGFIIYNLMFLSDIDARSLAMHGKPKIEIEVQNQPLESILNKSLNLHQKKIEIESDYNLDWFGFIPAYSPWETQLNVSFERLWNDLEAGSASTAYNTFNLTTKFQQRTPLGLTIDVNFDKMIDVPEVQGFLMKERISGNIYISLLNDFLGFNTQKILNATTEKNKKVFEDKTMIQTCQTISNQFFDAFLQEQNLNILSESVEDIDFIISKISFDAITQQNSLSLKMDKHQLLNRVIKASQMFKMSQLKLSDLTRIKVEDLTDLTLNENIEDLLNKQSQSFKIIDRLNLEIQILKARKKLIQLNQRNDISVYAGVRASETLVVNESSISNSNVIGLNFNWNFSNMQIENSKKSIEFEISKRNVQKDHILSQQKVILENFKLVLEDQFKTLKNLKQALVYADDLQKISVKNFLNGRIGFFEFLTSRNQVNSVKTDYNQALVDFYKSLTDQSVYLADVNAVCFLNNISAEKSIASNNH
jgi:hypothetical protein